MSHEAIVELYKRRAHAFDRDRGRSLPGESIGEYRGEPLHHASLAPEECGQHAVWLVTRNTVASPGYSRT